MRTLRCVHRYLFEMDNGTKTMIRGRCLKCGDTTYGCGRKWYADNEYDEIIRRSKTGAKNRLTSFYGNNMLVSQD